jgi:hypothetical protein
VRINGLHKYWCKTNAQSQTRQTALHETWYSAALWLGILLALASQAPWDALERLRWLRW